jgi:nucleoside-diphosphate-sugar epimerase
MTKSIVIFGGSGFIGSHLIDSIVSNGSSDIVSIDIKPPRRRLKEVKYIQADVRSLQELEFEGGIDRIYNLAAVHTTPGHPSHEYYETNIGGALQVVEFAKRHDVREIIFTSSISVYGPGEATKAETSELKPTSAYGYSKMLAEQVHNNWARENADRRLTIVRPAVVFGPGEGGNFTRLATLLRRGVFVYPGRRDTIKACIYVEDLLQAIEFARYSGPAVKTFNGSYARKYTLEDIVTTFIKNHFQSVKTYTIPKAFVLFVASVLKAMGGAKIGVHPDRVLKLVHSTDVKPDWLLSNGWNFSGGLDDALSRWAAATNKRFD